MYNQVLCKQIAFLLQSGKWPEIELKQTKNGPKMNE